MAQTLKVLGQALPAAATLTDLYVVPAAASASCSSVIVCNQVATATSFRIAVAKAGAANASAQYVYFDLPLAASDTFIATIGMTLAATDVVRVYSASGSVSFNLFGAEVT